MASAAATIANTNAHAPVADRLDATRCSSPRPNASISGSEIYPPAKGMYLAECMAESNNQREGQSSAVVHSM